jgi:tungstate transport system substrate-binding protein
MFRNAGRSFAALLTALHLVLFAGLTGAGAQTPSVRVALVNTPDDLLRALAPEFQAQTGQRLEIVYIGEEPYDVARAGNADLVISHYGHHSVEPFMLEGLGFWPQMVFANQQALVGPRSDPAGVRGLTDATEAYRRIAGSGAPYVVNGTAGLGYLEDTLWEQAGQPERAEWYVDLGVQGRPAMEAAAQRSGYALWGLVPFIRSQAQRPIDLELLVTGDPLLQRAMVSIVVRPERVTGANADGGVALQRFLTSPSTQARISAFRYPGLDIQTWWPAGRHNSPAGRE